MPCNCRLCEAVPLARTLRIGMVWILETKCIPSPFVAAFRPFTLSPWPMHCLQRYACVYGLIMNELSMYLPTGPVALQVPPAYVPPPLLPSIRYRSPQQQSRHLCGASSWVSVERTHAPTESPSSVHQTNALIAPLEAFERKAAARVREGTAIGKEEHGLVCLERTIPDEIFRGLGSLADSAAPFKTQALRRTDTDQGWLDTLTTPLLRTSTSARACDQRKEPAQGPLRMTGAPLESDYPAATAVEADRLENAWRWLQADVKRVAGVFAQQVLELTDDICAGLPNTAVQQDAVDVTVKLELLRKGKCPRFHLDKVPLRLICTYVGRSTDWLDGYDRWEMEHNRSPPPACNLKISGGRKTRQARPGDVLIFRGQPQGDADAIGVAHRSPDVVEGQRRLVLTMDAGDILTASPGPG